MQIVPIEQVRRPLRRDQKPEAETAQRRAGREIATQRDTAMFRTAEITCESAGAATPYLVQRLGQLWPTPPRADAATASAAYARAGADLASHRAATLALVA